MIAVDTNLLIYAHRAESEWHGRAAEIVKGLAEGRSAWVIPWPCIHEFLAIVTHPRIFRPPTGIDAALDQVDAWMASPGLTLLSEPPDHWRRLQEQVAAARIRGPRIHDARIAAICIENGVRRLLSADRDFSRFPALDVLNPLVSG